MVLALVSYRRRRCRRHCVWLALGRSFKHFTFFINEFELIDKKELAPMAELIEMNLVSLTRVFESVIQRVWLRSSNSSDSSSLE